MEHQCRRQMSQSLGSISRPTVLAANWMLLRLVHLRGARDNLFPFRSKTERQDQLCRRVQPSVRSFQPMREGLC